MIFHITVREGVDLMVYQGAGKRRWHCALAHTHPQLNTRQLLRQRGYRTEAKALKAAQKLSDRLVDVLDEVAYLLKAQGAERWPRRVWRFWQRLKLFRPQAELLQVTLVSPKKEGSWRSK